VKNYKAMLAQADDWLPHQIERLRQEQAQGLATLRAGGLPTELTTHPTGQLIPDDGSAREAFQTPMGCMLHLIALFAWSRQVTRLKLMPPQIQLELRCSRPSMQRSCGSLKICVFQLLPPNAPLIFWLIDFSNALPSEYSVAI
jgi:hypothetical protein